MLDDMDDSLLGAHHEPCSLDADIPDQRVSRIAAASRLDVAQLPQYKFTLFSPLEVLRSKQLLSPGHAHSSLIRRFLRRSMNDVGDEAGPCADMP
ncbi:hypothetical protein [Rhodanobacter sp. C03]|uniref:hypothetical protein n=1 Tax=Rhodanobacter sp. C03 TaxID=1945858 RepID=UPI0009859B67|nr:hypothetical protein [Rhodanobacter sp. C03]OOG60201.1 hypothetical protein B0E48_05485 [Rhodanobacter sp. C03]